MPTREEISGKIRQDLSERGITPADPSFEFVLETLEAMNQGMADLDDELGDLASRIRWLADAPTWINQRNLVEFDGFVEARLRECEAALASVRNRWEQHRVSKRIIP